MIFFSKTFSFCSDKSCNVNLKLGAHYLNSPLSTLKGPWSATPLEGIENKRRLQTLSIDNAWSIPFNYVYSMLKTSHTSLISTTFPLLYTIVM